MYSLSFGLSHAASCFLHTAWRCTWLAQVRPKRVTVEAVECLEGRPHYFNMRLRTQAGTYVKEFCHGCVREACVRAERTSCPALASPHRLVRTPLPWRRDLGRSHPSLATLLGAGRVEILQLDVLEVHMEEWPVQQG